MTAQDIQKQLASAIVYLSKTTNTYPSMVKSYGSDWRKWPKTSNWYKALAAITAASAAVGKLPAPPVAAFTWKES